MLSYLQKTISIIALLFGLSLISYAQHKPIKKDSLTSLLSPLFMNAYKNPEKHIVICVNPGFLRPTNQLMSWPNYYLTAAQIMERDKKNDQPFAKQIANEIFESYVNGIINGRNRKPVANIPKF